MFRQKVRNIMRNAMHAHGKTHMATCTYGPANAAPLGILSSSKNIVTSACTFHGSIVALPVPLLLKKTLVYLGDGLQTCTRSGFEPLLEDAVCTQHKQKRKYAI